MRRFDPRCSALAILFAGIANLGVDAGRASIGAPSGLAGCWERTQGDRLSEEPWMRPLGGLIFYRRQPDGSLLARIEGEEKGRVRAFEYSMRRASCPDDAGR